MSLRSWLGLFVTSGVLAFGALNTGVAGAQQPTPPTTTPTAATAPAASAPATTIPQLPEVEVVAEPPAPSLTPNFQPFAAEPTNISTTNAFTAPPTEGYFSSGSATGSWIAVPNLRNPATVTTVTRDTIRDQQALSISEILRDMGGAQQSNFDNLRPDAFLLRGLEVQSYNFRKNGVMDPTYTPRDFANVERIDVLKGPSSLAYGAGGPSGTVNVITKKAQQDRFARADTTFGSWDLQRYTFDVNNMNQAGDILFRLNAAYQHNNSFRNFGFNEREFFAPTMTFLLSDDTSLTLEGELHKDRRRTDSGIIAVNGNARVLSDETFYGVDTDRRIYHDYRGTINLNHRINDDWQFNIIGSTLFYDAEGQITNPQTGFTTTLGPQGFYAGAPGIGGLLNRAQNTATMFAEQNHALIMNLSGDFDTGPITHHTVFGSEANWFVVNHDQFTTSIPGLDPALTFSPATGLPQPFPGGTVSQSFTFDNPGYRRTGEGLYFQDYMDLTDRLHVVGGVRWDTLNVVYNRNLQFGGFPIFAPPTEHQTYDRWSPKAGIVYEVVPGALSTYGMWTRSFSPPSGSVFAQNPGGLLPEYGETWEGGVKANIFEDLTLTLGGFWIERDNVAQQITNFNVVNNVRQRSQGVEANLIGNWTDRLSTVSNYTYADVTQTGPAGFPAVNGRVRGVPFGSGNVWTRYNLLQERERTLGVGLGYVYVGERRGDYTTPLELPAYSRWDMGLFGRYRRLDATAYIENIFDVRYETGSINQYQVYPGAPVNFRLNMGITF